MDNRSPYIVDAPSVSVIMFKVLLALIPGIALYVYAFGLGVIVNITLASLTVVLTESSILAIRKLPIRPFILDGSGLVTAWLLALSIPSIAPWWIIVLGTLLCIIFGKHIYGGLGYNLFNPAMVGYAILLISFPSISRPPSSRIWATYRSYIPKAKPKESKPGPKLAEVAGT